jgi:cyanate lyase
MSITADPNLARVLQEAKQRRGITYHRLVNLTGLSIVTVRYAFQGLATPRTRELVALALGLDPRELEAGEGRAP